MDGALWGVGVVSEPKEGPSAVLLLGVSLGKVNYPFMVSAISSEIPPAPLRMIGIPQFLSVSQTSHKMLSMNAAKCLVKLS